jgi:hypothetical protein
VGVNWNATGTVDDEPEVGMSDGADRTVLPIRRPAFSGVAGKTLQERHLGEARRFADGLANRLLVSTSELR